MSGPTVETSTADEPAAARGGHAAALPADASYAAYAEQQRLTRPPDTLFHWAVLGMCMAVVVLAATLTIQERTQVLIPFTTTPLPELCHFKRWSGIDCPGCGMTRAFISLARGRVVDAWRYNPAGFLLFPIVVFQIPYRIGQIWRLRSRQPEWVIPKSGRFVLGSLATVLITQWVVRQIGIGF